jgi:5'-deoxynucleotidase YfbR-like HD superfamily hydrolase
MTGGKQSHGTVKKELDALTKDFLSYAIARSSAIRRYNTAKVIVDQNDLEHMGAVTMISMLFSDYFNKIGIRNDTEKVMRIAITHDLDEAVVGDVPHDAKYQFGEHSKKLRKALEQLSNSNVESMYNMIKRKDLRSMYMSLYKEQKTRKSVESKIVKLADYIDVIIYCENESRMGNRELVKDKENASARFNEMLEKILLENKMAK